MKMESNTSFSYLTGKACPDFFLISLRIFGVSKTFCHFISKEMEAHTRGCKTSKWQIQDLNSSLSDFNVPVIFIPVG